LLLPAEKAQEWRGSGDKPVYLQAEKLAKLLSLQGSFSAPMYFGHFGTELERLIS
jgi:hypothetical protein